MQRDDKGLWTVTIGPVVPGFHYYWLQVDGFACSDPATQTYFGWNKECSGIEVPDKTLGFYDIKDVPHGEVRTRWYYSRVTGMWRRAMIYTPPYYDRDVQTRYPVLYLQHGAGENERGWTSQGRANFILDNLIAERNGQPMIVVMENGMVAPKAGADPRLAESGAMRRRNEAFADMVVNDLVPMIDATYRTVPDRTHRAVAGLSMGASQAMQIGFANPDEFGYTGMFSGGGAARSNLSPSGPRPLLVWMGAGTAESGRVTSAKATVETMSSAGIPAVWFEAPGTSHEWQTWRRCLYDFAPRLFQPTHVAEAEPDEAVSWQVGKPIVTYWCGPSLTDSVAQQMAEGGFNLVWCANERELDVAQRHGLRGQLSDGLLSPASLDDPKHCEQLDALIARVSKHPAFYSYYLIDEPNASQFPAFGKLVAYLRQRDPLHLAYINLFPTYATNEQLATKGDVVTAYEEYLRRYTEQVKPSLISYDHYQFRLKGDGDQYFLNLAMIRRAAQEAGVPFLNIVQACTWAPDVMRVPNVDELRYLVYSTLAYGAQGISYYVYACANHRGSLVGLDGTPGPLYRALVSYNREFVAIARELQPLRSMGVYHTSMREPGCEPLPADAPFHLDPSQTPAPPRGFLLGLFGSGETPNHAVVVNLDYTTEVSALVAGPREIELFDASAARWTSAQKAAVELILPPGGGRLVRITR
jgi:enterochelin esterase-like enzyme